MSQLRLGVVLAFASSLLVLTPCLAGAQGSETPAYDIPTYCEQVSQVVGGSYAIKAQCVKDERTSLAAVRVMPGLDSRMVSYCSQVGEVIGGSYQIYEQCLKDEREAKGSTE